LYAKSITDPDTGRPYPATAQHAMRGKGSNKATK